MERGEQNNYEGLIVTLTQVMTLKELPSFGDSENLLRGKQHEDSLSACPFKYIFNQVYYELTERHLF
jgi:hypothetical protein